MTEGKWPNGPALPGFALVQHPTVARDPYNDKEVREVYYPVAESFIRAKLRADRVFIFDHTMRKRVEGAADVRGRVRALRNRTRCRRKSQFDFWN